MPTNTGALLSIRLFGILEIQFGGVSLHPQPPRRAQRLLVLLILLHGKEVPRAVLAEKLWPETDEEQMHNNLRQCLFELRKALGTEAHRVSATREMICLDLRGVEVD